MSIPKLNDSITLDEIFEKVQNKNTLEFYASKKALNLNNNTIESLITYDRIYYLKISDFTEDLNEMMFSSKPGNDSQMWDRILAHTYIRYGRVGYLKKNSDYYVIIEFDNNKKLNKPLKRR